MRPRGMLTSDLGSRGQKSDQCYQRDRNEGEGGLQQKIGVKSASIFQAVVRQNCVLPLEFPGGLVVRILDFSLLWSRFNPWSGN